MRTLGAATVVLALAAGCTGDPDPVPTMPVVVPTATPSPSPTPDPATVPPERPDLSRVDAATAEALAVYFLELYPYVYATGDLTEWRALSHPDCKFCRSVITNVEQLIADGYVAGGGEIAVADPETRPISNTFFDVELTASQDAMVVYDSLGAVVAHYEAKTYRVALGVAYDEGMWLIDGVDTGVEE
jgi:hypothetical protein